MPQGPPSPAVAITETGTFSAPAKSCCAVPGVLKKPPWPSSASMRTCSSARMSMPIFSVTIAPYTS